jgi:dihydroneopterin aldolase
MRPLAMESERLASVKPRTLEVASRDRAESRAAVGHSLSLRGLEVDVHLGCTEPERARPQRISISLAIRFERAPGACESDDLSETVCMAALAEALGDVCRTREFALLEHLTQELHTRALTLVPCDGECELEVTKLTPPIANLTGGFAFSLRGRGTKPSGAETGANAPSFITRVSGALTAVRLRVVRRRVA